MEEDSKINSKSIKKEIFSELYFVSKSLEKCFINSTELEFT